MTGTVDQAAVIEQRREQCSLSEHYLFMTAMSGGIAILGLLLSSPAVVIGAMLLSPLMEPIMGIGFALAIGDYRWLRKSASMLAVGSALAVGLCAAIVFLSPLTEITSEIAARTRPNLFDLLVALFSGLAGAYAMIRGRAGTIVGVAIATALMPPLAVVGFGLATFNWTVFGGALLLFVTNLLTIALSAWGMARLYGFHNTLSEKQTMFQTVGLFGAFIGLAVPLGFSLVEIGREARAAQQVRAVLTENFGSAARLSQPEIDFAAEPVRVSAYVWTTQLKPQAEARAERALAQVLGEPVRIDLTQYLVRDERSAEAAQVASAKEQEEAAATDRVKDLGNRLALVAGVDEADILLDTSRRRAFVRARPLPGASLATYRALERRIAQTEPNWKVELVPPALALQPVTFASAGEEPETTATGAEARELLLWASTRTGLPVVLDGRDTLVALLEAELAEAGADATAGAVTAGGLTVTPRWGAPQ